MSGTYVKVTGSVYVPDVAYICWISVKSTGVDVHVQLASVPEVKTRSKLFAVPTVETGAAGVKLKRLIKWHDDVIKWNHFPRYWPFVWGIYRSPVNSPHKAELWVFFYQRLNKRLSKNRDAGNLRRHRALYDVIVMRKVRMRLLNNVPPTL